MKALVAIALLLGSVSAMAAQGDGFEWYDSSHLPNKNPSPVVSIIGDRPGFEYYDSSALPNPRGGKGCLKGEKFTTWVADATNSRDVLVTFVCKGGVFVAR